MTYTFWHCGVLIGESKLEQRWNNRGQRAGIFHPTAYGLEIFPRLSGILSVAHALKSQLEAGGASADALTTDEAMDLLENSPTGQKIIDLGRMLSDVEVRAPDGTTQRFSSIAFSDLEEIRRLARELDGGRGHIARDIPLSGARYLVSATFRRESRDRDRERRVDSGPRGRPSADN